ncbi:MAG TPA: hypothetical protein VNB06_09410 [Thermoanaerobaculia bacterium]|nr:hypothetical protein [Thermoanaerobaculia bacterium]
MNQNDFDADDDSVGLPGRAELLELATGTGSYCVSLYMPTARSGTETRQNPIRYKNLLKEAEDLLAASGLDGDQVEAALKPARELVDQYSFWQAQGDGLAAFVSPGTFVHYRLPIAVAERVVLGERPYLKPLLPLLELGQPFHVLALSQNHVRLFRCQRSDGAEVDLGDTPRSLTEAVGSELEQQSLQFHTGTPDYGGGARGRSAVFHGHGGGNEKEDSEIERFLQLVDQGVQRRIDPAEPLIVAAVSSLISGYRAVSGLPSLLEEGIEGNPDEMSGAQLADAGWRLVEGVLERKRVSAVDEYREKQGRGRTTDELATVLQASREGRVGTLFVAIDRDVWGRFSSEEEGLPRLEVHEERAPLDVELLDHAAVECLQRGGEVYAASQDELPGPAPIAAILRY